MAWDLVQTDTSATFNVGCSTRSAGSTTAGRQAISGGTAGATEVTIDPGLDTEASQRAVMIFESGAPNVAEWADGTWTVPVNITTCDAGTILREVWICDNNGGTFSTVGSNTSPGHTRGATGVVTVNIVNPGLHTPQSQANSTVFIVLVFSNNDPHGQSSAGVTPNQTINTPIVVGGAEVTPDQATLTWVANDVLTNAAVAVGQATLTWVANDATATPGGVLVDVNRKPYAASLEAFYRMEEATGNRIDAHNGKLLSKLSAFYQLDDDGTWADATGKRSGFSETGNPTTRAGKHGNGLDTSTGNYLFMVNANAAWADLKAGPWSVAFWFNADALPGNYAGLLHHGAGSDTEEGFSVALRSTGDVYFFVGDGASRVSAVTGGGTLAAGNDYFVVATYENTGGVDGVRVRVFNDTGAQIGTTGTAADFANDYIDNNAALIVGGQFVSDLDGMMDSVAFFADYALTDSDITLMLNGGDGRDYLSMGGESALTGLTVGLRAFWRLEEASGTRVDSHGSNDLVVVNEGANATGKHGNAFAGYDINDEIGDKTVDLLNTGDYTIVGWLRCNDPSTVANTLIDHRSATNTGGYRIRVSNSTDVQAQVFNNAGTQIGGTLTVSGMTQGNWYMYAYTLDRDGNHRLQVFDSAGVQLGTAQTGDISSASAENWPNGIAIQGSTDAQFEADSTCTYSRILSDFEIRLLLNGGYGRDYSLMGDIAGTGLTTGLDGFWRLEESGANDRLDSHGTKHLSVVGTVSQETGHIGNAAGVAAGTGNRLEGSAASAIGTGDATICGWLYAVTSVPTSGSLARLVSDPRWQIHFDTSGTLRGNFSRLGGDNFTTNTGTGLTADTWYFVALRLDRSGNMTIQVFDTSGDQVGSDGTLDISAWSADNMASGYVLEDVGSSALRFDTWSAYTRLLTDVEIRELLNYGIGRDYGDLFQHDLKEQVGALPSIAGKHGNALNLNAAGNFLKGGPVPGTDDFTVTFWWQHALINQAGEIIHQGERQVHPGWALQQGTLNDQLRWNVTKADATLQFNQLLGFDFADATWYFIAITYDRSANAVLRAYDEAGALVLTVTNSISAISSEFWAHPMRFGGGNTGDEPRIDSFAWHRALLTDAEILDLLRDGNGRDYDLYGSDAAIRWVANNIVATVAQGVTPDQAILIWVANDTAVTAGGVSVNPAQATLPWVANNVLADAEVAVSQASLVWVANDATATPGNATAAPAQALLSWVANDTAAAPGGVSITPTQALLPWVANNVLTNAAVAPAGATLAWVSNDAGVTAGGVSVAPAQATLPWVANDVLTNAAVAVGQAALVWIANDTAATPGNATANPAFATLVWVSNDVTVDVGASVTPDQAILVWVSNDAGATPGGVAQTPDFATLSWVSNDAVAAADGVAVTPDFSALAWVANDVIADSTVTPDQASLVWVSNDATATPGNVSAAPAQAVLVWVANDTTATAGANVTPDAAILTWVSNDTVTAAGGVIVSPAFAPLVWVSNDAATTPGAVAVNPALATLVWVANDTTATTGIVVTPDVATLAWVANDAATTPGGVTTAPAQATLSWVANDAQAVPGSVAVAPAFAALAWVANDTIADAVVAVNPATLAWVANDAAATAGGVAVSPAEAVLVWVANDTSTAAGASVTPDQAVLVWTANDSLAAAGGVSVAAQQAVLVWVANDTVAETGAVVTPDPAILTWAAQDAPVTLGAVAVSPTGALVNWVVNDVASLISGLDADGVIVTFADTTGGGLAFDNGSGSAPRLSDRTKSKITFSQ